MVAKSLNLVKGTYPKGFVGLRPADSGFRVLIYIHCQERNANRRNVTCLESSSSAKRFAMCRSCVKHFGGGCDHVDS